MNDLIKWYNGYKSTKGLSIYNPRSVCFALGDGVCQSYWTNTVPIEKISYSLKITYGIMSLTITCLS